MKKEFIIEGMSCGHCIMAVKKELHKLEGFDIKVEIGKAEIDSNDKPIPDNEVQKLIENAGYKVLNVV